MALIVKKFTMTSILEMLKGRYLQDGNWYYQVEGVYGLKLFCHLVDNGGNVSNILTVLELKDGMNLLDELPTDYIVGNIEEETAEQEGSMTVAQRRRRGPSAWEVLDFLYRNEGRWHTLRQISTSLGYGSEEGFRLSKGRMVRFLKIFGNVIEVDRDSREHEFMLGSDMRDQAMAILFKLRGKTLATALIQDGSAS